MIKGSNIFGGSKIGKNLQLFGRAHYRATRKISRGQNSSGRTFIQNPKNCTLGDIQRFCYHS
jgi:hypothetical protein